MPLRTIYVTIVWIPGQILFDNKKKRICMHEDVTPEQLAQEMLEIRAETLKGRTMSNKAIEELYEDFYYEIYDSPESKKPFSKSRKAP